MNSFIFYRAFVYPGKFNSSFDKLFDDLFEDVVLLLQVSHRLNIVGNSLLLIFENFLCLLELQVELSCIFSRVSIRMVLQFSLTECAF